jgi:hypothetical protein
MGANDRKEKHSFAGNLMEPVGQMAMTGGAHLRERMRSSVRTICKRTGVLAADVSE